MRQSIPAMMDNAQRGRYAVGYFESWNLESLHGVIDAAEQTRSPVIIGFNGEFLTRAERIAPECICTHAALAKSFAEEARIPCAVLFNECPLDDCVRLAVDAGFDFVMSADGDAPLEQYTRRVAALAKYAHDHGAAIEAEIGELPCGQSGLIEDGTGMTDPEIAAKFVRDTGVDMLAVSVGNVHILVNGQKELNLDHLQAIREKVEIPLDLHGGTGITSDSLRQAIGLGVTKATFGTYIKQRYLSAVRKALGSEDVNPHKLLGLGGVEDVMVAGRLAVRDAVLERIEVLGCCGRA